MKSTRPLFVSGRTPAAVPSELDVRVVGAAEQGRFDELLAQKHYLGTAPPVGDFLRQVIIRDGQWIALLVWGPAALKLKDRDRWIGWNLTQQLERLKLVVQNRRYLLLHAKGTEPNLASQALAAACRALPGQWQERFGYRPLLAESFTDPEAFTGTCYKASGWEAVGFSAGHRRHRADYYQAGGRPKRLWLKELCHGARSSARALQLPPACAAAAVAAPHGLLPLNASQQRSLLRCSVRRTIRVRATPAFALGRCCAWWRWPYWPGPGRSARLPVLPPG